jgi:flagellar hook-associated protein 2
MANNFQVDGIVSGLRTADIVAQLMAVERQPLLNLERKKLLEQDRQKAWDAVKANFSSLQSVAQRLTLRSTVNPKTATTDTPTTNPAIVSASAGADAAIGSFRVKVHQLASATIARGSATLGSAVSPAALLKDAGFTTAVDTTKYTDQSGAQQDRFFTINGQQITVTDTDTLNSVVTKMQTALPGWTVELTTDAAGRANNALRIIAPDASTPLQLGAGNDTSNFLKAANLAGAQVTRQGSVGAVTPSDASSDAGTVSGTFSGASNINYVVRVAEVDSFGDSGTLKAATKVQISTDGGATFGSAVSVSNGAVDVGNGLTLNFGAAGTTTTAGDTYSFSATAGNSVAVSALPLAGLSAGGAIGGVNYAARFTGGAVGAAGGLKINGVDVYYSLDDSVNSIISRINGSTAGVRASYDAATDKIQLTNIATGGRAITVEKSAASKIERSNSTSDDFSVTSYTGATNVNYVFKVDAVAGESSTTVGATSVLVSRDGGATFDPTPVAVDPVTGEVNLAGDGLTVKFGVSGTTTAVNNTYSFTAYTPNNHFVDRAGLATGSLVQTYGANALYSIDDGAVQSSDTNVVSNAVPGVSVTLKRAQASSDNAVTVSVAQDSTTPKKTLQEFVAAYNTILDTIEKHAKYDQTAKKGGPLTGDTTIMNIERQLRSLVSSTALGINSDSKYRSLADIGVSTGKAGSVLGTTNRLSVDDSKLSAALADNPQAVETLLTSLQASAGSPSLVAGAPADSIDVNGITGRPTATYQTGTYRLKIADAAAGKAELWFDVSGTSRKIKDATVTAGVDQAGLVAGLTIKMAAVLVNNAESKFTVSVTQRGTMVWMKNSLDNMLGSSGVFQSRTDGSTSATNDINRRISNLEARLEEKETRLYRKFAALEAAMARSQNQSSSLISSIARMNISGGSDG